MKAFRLCLIFVMLIFSMPGLAKNFRPSSGRPLQYNHWLTCWGGYDQRVRASSHMLNKDTPQEVVDADVPKFSGSYKFEVKDTWEEWVTHSGTDCTRCGQTCQTLRDKDGKTYESCSCNYCSWQELETFYRPWSVQRVKWAIDYIPDAEYRQRRIKWFQDGKPKISRGKSDLAQLLIFDPERPQDYYLFPGEMEQIEVSNGGGYFSAGTSITPSVSIANARIDYSQTGRIDVQSSYGNQFECDDRDFNIAAQIHAGNRITGTTPNSLEFRKGWVKGAQTATGAATEEPYSFQITDLSAMRYEGQNFNDHYKDTTVQVWMREVSRLWLSIDKTITYAPILSSDNSKIQWMETEDSNGNPPAGNYEIKAQDLLKTPWLKSETHLAPNSRYELCTRMINYNNVYYDTSYLYFWSNWSETICAVFDFNPEKQQDDLRSGGRKFRDMMANFLPVPWL
jgi:hypothetical protein